MGGACCQFEGLQKFNAVGVGFAFYLGMFGAVDKRFESFTWYMLQLARTLYMNSIMSCNIWW